MKCEGKTIRSAAEGDMLEIGDGARARYGLGIGLSSLSFSRSLSLSLSLSPPIVIGIAMGVDPEEVRLGAGEVENGKEWPAGDEGAFGFLRGLRAAAKSYDECECKVKKRGGSAVRDGRT